jgi:predicted RNase H-like nuclease (RuvC/YqgF family)
MEEFQIDLYAFLGVLEVAFILLVITLVFVVRSRSLAGRIRALQMKLKKAQAAPDPVGFDQYLRDEVIRNQALIDRAAGSEDNTEQEAVDLLKMRKQFLELELEARALEKNPVEFQARIAAGLHELIEQLRPEPETVTETVIEEADTPAQADVAAAETAEARSTVDTHDAEFNRLKDVINNQQDAMEALRSELRAREHEIEDLDAIMQKLDEFERQSSELEHCLSVLEEENERLKQARSSAPSAAAKIDSMDPGQLTGLKSMVSQQQTTISKFQKLIQELAPEASKAKELEDAIENIRRANQELNGCVAVLEDENTMLRAELEEIQSQLEQQTQAAAENAPLEEAAAETMDIEEIQEESLETVSDEFEELEDGTSDDDEKRELEIKVQELEALVEFKDAAIEELEKQYNKLEAKYMEVTGEKKVD